MPKISLGRQKGCATKECVKSTNICCATAAISLQRPNKLSNDICGKHFIKIIKSLSYYSIKCCNFGPEVQLKFCLCKNQNHVYATI